MSEMLLSIMYLGKVLIIGGGIANFTNVAATFKVSIALLEFCVPLVDFHSCKIQAPYNIV